MIQPKSFSSSWTAMVLAVAIGCFSAVIATSSLFASPVMAQDKSDQDKKAETSTDQEKKSETKSDADPKTTQDSKAGKDSQPGKADQSKASNQDHPVQKMLDEWSALQVELNKAYVDHNNAINKEDRDRTEKAYMDLYAKGIEHIEKIQNQALELIAKDPNDETSLNALAGILIYYANEDDRDAECFALAEKMLAANVAQKYFDAARSAPRMSLFNKAIFDEITTRNLEQQDEDLPLPRVKIVTDKGEMVAELFENEAPETVGNFISLIESGFYNGSPFHRVIEDFVAQGGQAAEGKKEVDYTIVCECVKPDARLHYKGSLSMAHRGRNTGSSEFFITMKKTSFLDRNHTVFGRVISGLDVLDKITRTHNQVLDPATRTNKEIPIKDATPAKIVKIEILRKRDHEYKPNKVNDDRPDNNPDSDSKLDDSGDKKSEDKSGDKKAEDKK